MAVPSGRVYLCKNAIVDINSAHTITFTNPSEQEAYWGSLVKYTIEKVTPIRRNNQAILVPYNLEQLQDINYMYFYNIKDHKTYYCFVTNKEFSSENGSIIYFKTDVMQTYQFDYEVKQSYVLQEHQDRWDANHKPIYSRTDEGLDYGSEYTLEKSYRVKPTYGGQEVQWFLIILKSGLAVDSGNSAEPTKIRRTANPYAFYLAPSIDIEGMLYQMNYYTNIEGTDTPTISSIGTIEDFMDEMSDSSIGNYVVAIIKLNYLPFNFTYNMTTSPRMISVFNDNNVRVGYSKFTASNKPYMKILEIKDTFDFRQNLVSFDVLKGIESTVPTDEQWAEIKSNPYNVQRDRRFESKLLCYPYRYNLFTDWKTTPQVIKNEYIGGDKIKINYMQSFSFNAPSRYWIENYKKDSEGRENSILQLTPEEQPIINDAYYTYMLENKNQIQANQTNAIVSGVAGTGQSMVQGAIGGAISGGPIGAILGALGGGLSSGLSSGINYQNMVRSENAKQRDLKNLPDTIVNTNDCAFNILDKNNYISFYRYKICCEFEEQLADTWNMTGYTVKRVKVPNLKTRLRFNYVKTVGANIVGSFNQDDLREIKQIFDNGITFWHYNKDNFKPFDYSYENIERSLI